jgi:hypothetical protein
VKISIISIGIAIFSLLLGSCGKETQSTTQGGGKLVIKLRSSPANNTEGIVIGNMFNVGTSVKFYVPKKNSGLVLTDTFNVTAGQNFPIALFGGVTNSCSNITVEAYLNGKLYKTKTFNVGGNGIGFPGSGPSDICDYAATILTSGISGIPYNITID